MVRRWRVLHDSRGRREQGLLLLEGTHLLQETLRIGLTPVEIAATEAWMLRHPELVRQLPPSCPVRRITADVLEFMATTRHPDGVLLTLHPPVAAACGGDAAAETDFWLVLDTIQDPGNLGTLMRTALAAEVDALWLADGADPFQPKVLRSSAGAALALPLWRGDRPALVERLQALRDQRSVQLVASVPPGRGGLPYWQIDWTRATVLLLGSEGAGLAPGLQDLADQRVTVPHGPAVESLNVAIAAAPLLLERQRQRQAPQHQQLSSKSVSPPSTAS